MISSELWLKHTSTVLMSDYFAVTYIHQLLMMLHTIVNFHKANLIIDFNQYIDRFLVKLVSSYSIKDLEIYFSFRPGSGP